MRGFQSKDNEVEITKSKVRGASRVLNGWFESYDWTLSQRQIYSELAEWVWSLKHFCFLQALFHYLCSSSKRAFVIWIHFFWFPSHLLNCRRSERYFSILSMFRSPHELFLNYNPNIPIVDTAFFSGESYCFCFVPGDNEEQGLLADASSTIWYIIWWNRHGNARRHKWEIGKIS